MPGTCTKRQPLHDQEKEEKRAKKPRVAIKQEEDEDEDVKWAGTPPRERKRCLSKT